MAHQYTVGYSLPQKLANNKLSKVADKKLKGNVELKLG